VKKKSKKYSQRKVKYTILQKMINILNLFHPISNDKPSFTIAGITFEVCPKDKIHTDYFNDYCKYVAECIVSQQIEEKIGAIIFKYHDTFGINMNYGKDIFKKEIEKPEFKNKFETDIKEYSKILKNRIIKFYQQEDLCQTKDN